MYAYTTGRLAGPVPSCCERLWGIDTVLLNLCFSFWTFVFAHRHCPNMHLDPVGIYVDQKHILALNVPVES